MRINYNKKTTLYPMPVLIIGTYDNTNTPNLMNAAWGGIVDTNKIGICIDSNHKTFKNILLNKEFSVAIGTKDTVTLCDYVGLVSGNNINKLEHLNLAITKSSFINAPLIEEFPFILECRVCKIIEEDDLVIADIVNVSVDEKILQDNNKIDINKLSPLVYNTIDHTYLGLGEKIADAFSEGKKLIK